MHNEKKKTSGKAVVVLSAVYLITHKEQEVGESKDEKGPAFMLVIMMPLCQRLAVRHNETQKTETLPQPAKVLHLEVVSKSLKCHGFKKIKLT